MLSRNLAYLCLGIVNHAHADFCEARLNTFLRQIPELIYITEPVGIADFEFEVVVGSVNRMQEILMQLRSEFSDMIKDYEMVEIGKPALIRYFPD